MKDTATENYLPSLQMALSVLAKHGLSEKTFCLAPYKDIDLDQNGSCMSCHWGKRSLGNWKANSVKQEYNNESYKELRSNQRKGITDSNCSKCRSAESKGSRSLRHRWLSDTFSELGYEGFDDLIKKIAGNNCWANTQDISRGEVRTLSLCNLRCMHCDARSSTQWMNWQTRKDIFDRSKDSGVWIPDGSTYSTIKDYFGFYNKDTDYSNETKEILANCKILQFSGGEPLMDPTHLDWLDYFVNVSQTSAQMSLDYNSNLNITDLEQYFDYWHKFKQLKFRVSLDSSPSTYRFFRRNGDFGLVQRNIDMLKNRFNEQYLQGTLLGTITFNFFAALRWKEIMKWFGENNINFHSSLVIGGPVDATYLPIKLRQAAISDMEQCMRNIKAVYPDYEYADEFIFYTNDCVQYLKNSKFDSDELWKDSQVYFRMHDDNTHLNTVDFFPELQEYLGVHHGLA